MRVFEATLGQAEPIEIRPDMDKPRSHWSRRELAFWLADVLADTERAPCLVGIDHALSFPIEYFELHGLQRDWDSFLNDFCAHWPTDVLQNTVLKILNLQKSAVHHRLGNARWRRLADRSAGGAKSVFHFGVPGAVASSTHAGLPWIRFLRADPRLLGKVHFWPFDGWVPPLEKSVVAEVYPALWNSQIKRHGFTQDQHDACCVSLQLRAAAQDGCLTNWFSPQAWTNVHCTLDQLQIAQIEGWILGSV